MTTKDLSRENEELKQKLAAAEAILKNGRYAFNDLNERGKTILDFFNVWLDQSQDRVRVLEKAIRSIEPWEYQDGAQLYRCMFCGVRRRSGNFKHESVCIWSEIAEKQ